MVEGRSNVTGVHSHACLNLIDLAGSERVGAPRPPGVRLDEAKCINKSLSALGDVHVGARDRELARPVPQQQAHAAPAGQPRRAGQDDDVHAHRPPSRRRTARRSRRFGFGTRVSQVTLGAAKQNREGAELFAARETIMRLESGTQGVEAERERLRSETAALRKEAADAVARERRAETGGPPSSAAETDRLRAEVKDAKASAAVAAASGAMSSRAGSPPMAALPEEDTDCDTDGGSTPGGCTPPPRQAAAPGARKPRFRPSTSASWTRTKGGCRRASESAIPSASLQVPTPPALPLLHLGPLKPSLPTGSFRAIPLTKACSAPPPPQTPQTASKIPVPPATASKIPQKTPATAVSRAVSRARDSTNTAAGSGGRVRPQTAVSSSPEADSGRPGSATARKAAVAAAIPSSAVNNGNAAAAGPWPGPLEQDGRGPGARDACRAQVLQEGLRGQGHRRSSPPAPTQVELTEAEPSPPPE